MWCVVYVTHYLLTAFKILKTMSWYLSKTYKRFQKLCNNCDKWIIYWLFFSVYFKIVIQNMKFEYKRFCALEYVKN